ncbi:MAG TPA: hypothetical protein VFX12_03960 [Vicinamibacterales bacterium]|nr:hypothetical protein [Vicinamibacterales bacterium]
MLLCGIFLRAIASFYRPGVGFTRLVGFPEDRAEPAALRQVPHAVSRSSYDGAFYAVRALDPLVRDPAVDRYMDSAPFRARRVLFSWTAYVIGFGHPAWILEAFALQNVLAWLLLAILLTRWLDLGTPRGLALWIACLFSHGLLWSVRLSLLDGPSLVLIAAAVWAAEAQRPFLSAAMAGIAGLARETNVIAAAAIQPPSSRREWLRAVVLLVIVVAPVLIWMDYLWSIYRSGLVQVNDPLGFPGMGLVGSFRRTWQHAAASGGWSREWLNLALVVSMAVEGLYVATHWAWRRSWWRVALGYVLLMLLLGRSLWDPHTGAITRVLLPLTVGFNVELGRRVRGPAFWVWFALGNLHLLAAPYVMPIF